jgi:hypothetical protein
MLICLPLKLWISLKVALQTAVGMCRSEIVSAVQNALPCAWQPGNRSQPMQTAPKWSPSPMTARTGRTQESKQSAHTLESTGSRRFLVIEQDKGTLDDQAAVLLHLAARAPLALGVHSGSKSIHG